MHIQGNFKDIGFSLKWIIFLSLRLTPTLFIFSHLILKKMESKNLRIKNRS